MTFEENIEGVVALMYAHGRGKVRISKESGFQVIKKMIEDAGLKKVGISLEHKFRDIIELVFNYGRGNFENPEKFKAMNVQTIMHLIKEN